VKDVTPFPLPFYTGPVSQAAAPYSCRVCIRRLNIAGDGGDAIAYEFSVPTSALCDGTSPSAVDSAKPGSTTGPASAWLSAAVVAAALRVLTVLLCSRSDGLLAMALWIVSAHPVRVVTHEGCYRCLAGGFFLEEDLSAGDIVRWRGGWAVYDRGLAGRGWVA